MSDFSNNSPSGAFRRTNVLSAQEPRQLTMRGVLCGAFNQCAATTGPDHVPVLTDLLSRDVKFHVPTIQAESTIDVSKPVSVAPEGANASNREDVKNVANAYMKINDGAMNKIHDAIMKVDPESGGKVWSALAPQQPSSDIARALSPLVDPTGGAGAAAYETIRAVTAHKANNPKINEVLTKALSTLQNDSTKQLGLDPTKNAATPALDFRAIQTAKQLQNFIQRDVTKDPVMQRVTKANQALDLQDQNKVAYDRDYPNTGDIAAKTKLALEMGDQEMVKALTKNESAAEALTAGTVKEASLSLTDINGALKGNITIDVDALTNANKTQMPKPSENLEFDFTKLGLDKPQASQLLRI